MKVRIPNPSQELNQIFSSLEEIVKNFRQRPAVQVQSNIIYVSDVTSVFEITNTLGSGSQASVHSAILRSNGKEVAVKMENKQMSEKQKVNFEVMEKGGVEG